jgi:hypothetical protein
MTKTYTREETISLLQEAAVLIMDEDSFRIDAVIEEEGEVYVTDEDTGEEHTLQFDDIDLSDPTVLLYKLTLMNGAD